METTTLRVRKSTQSRLKKISASEHISITELIDKLVAEHERSFWKGFDEESTVFLDNEEKKTREIYEKTLGDGVETRKATKKGRNLAR